MYSAVTCRHEASNRAKCSTCTTSATLQLLVHVTHAGPREAPHCAHTPSNGEQRTAVDTTPPERRGARQQPYLHKRVAFGPIRKQNTHLRRRSRRVISDPSHAQFRQSRECGWHQIRSRCRLSARRRRWQLWFSSVRATRADVAELLRRMCRPTICNLQPILAKLDSLDNRRTYDVSPHHLS